MVVVTVYVGILLMLSLSIALPSLAMAGAALGFLASIIWINPSWSFWLSEPFYAPVQWVYYSHHDHWRGGRRFNMMMGKMFNGLRWLQLSHGEGSIAARGPYADMKRHSVSLVLGFISGLLFTTSVLIS